MIINHYFKLPAKLFNVIRPRFKIGRILGRRAERIYDPGKFYAKNQKRLITAEIAMLLYNLLIRYI